MQAQPKNRADAIAIIRQLQEQLREANKQADLAVELYQQEKNRLIHMRTLADDQTRDIKLQCENTLNQLRQHIAKTQRESRREQEALRRKWLGIEDAKPQQASHSSPNLDDSEL